MSDGPTSRPNEHSKPSSDSRNVFLKEFDESLLKFVAGTTLSRAIKRHVDPDDQMDITQEVLLAMWRQWALLRCFDESRRMAYLYQVITFQVAAYQRRKIRERKQEDAWSSRAYFEQEHRFAGDIDAERHFRLRNARLWDADLWDAITTLSPRQRAAFLLHYVEGDGVEDIAKIFRTSEGTVKTHLSRARGKLASVIKQDAAHGA
ncbi:MAG TPA: sigma-70 family RNA polymerase sigma factor [Acidimicrobiales bacterium]|jgi:RNA polymerase sigma-70 factor (ECF subfamily)